MELDGGNETVEPRFTWPLPDIIATFDIDFIAFFAEFIFNFEHSVGI